MRCSRHHFKIRDITQYKIQSDWSLSIWSHCIHLLFNSTSKYKRFLTLNVCFFYLGKQTMNSVCNLMRNSPPLRSYSSYPQHVLFNVISLPQEVGQHCSRFFVTGLGQSHNRHMGELMVYIKIFSVLGFAWSSGLLTLPLSFIKPDWGRTLEKISVFFYVIFNGLQVKSVIWTPYRFRDYSNKHYPKADILEMTLIISCFHFLKSDLR